MERVEFVPLVLTDISDIYTIKVDDNKDTEFQKFLIMFKDSEDAYIKEDFDRILAAIIKISENGALESYFRIEGKVKDRICAIPLLISSRDKTKHGTLRLYCIRISDTLLIIGGGGLKKSDTYEEDSSLLAHVKRLQAIDSRLSSLENDGVILSDSIMNITVQID